MIIHLSKSLNIIFRKSHYVTFWSKYGTCPTKLLAFNLTSVDYPVYWTLKITLSAIGFKWKTSVDVLVSEFFLCWDLSILLFSSKDKGLCKFHFDSMYGGQDTPYGSNNMKVDK